MKKIFLAIAAIVAIGFVALAGRYGTDRLLAVIQDESGQGETPTGSESEGREATPVTTASPVEREVQDVFQAVGTVQPVRSIELRAVSEGRVTEVAAQSGATVTEGQLLFALDDRIAAAALAEAEATLAEARAEFRRFEELEDENVVPDARLEEARGAFRRAEAVAQAAQAELDDLRVTAPFGGVLGIVDLDPGERLDPGVAVTTLDDLTSVEVDFAVPERYFERVAPGQTVMLSGSAYPKRRFEGEVVLVAPRVGENSRSFVVRATVANDDRALVGGMFMNVTLVFGTREALVVPDDAIISEGTATYVYVAADDVAARTEVALGVREDGQTEITEGLGPEARVITTGYDTISDGDPVAPSESRDPQEALN